MASLTKDRYSVLLQNQYKHNDRSLGAESSYFIVLYIFILAVQKHLSKAQEGLRMERRLRNQKEEVGPCFLLEQANMTAPKGSTIEYSIKGEPRKLGVGSRQLRDFRNTRRVQAVQLAEEEGVPAVARLIRCSTRSIRDWIKSWHRGGEAALREKDRRPKHPHRIPEEKIETIVQIRDRQGYGCPKIAFDACARPAPSTSI